MTKKKYIVRKQLKWEGAHRLQSSYTKECQRLHGHSYKCDITAECEGLDPDGMVIDFKHIKDASHDLLKWLDHRTMLHLNDKPMFLEYVKEHPDDIIWVDFNPTAENMARWIHMRIAPSIKSLIGCANARALSISVSIHETCTGEATYKEEYDVGNKI